MVRWVTKRTAVGGKWGRDEAVQCLCPCQSSEEAAGVDVAVRGGTGGSHPGPCVLQRLGLLLGHVVGFICNQKATNLGLEGVAELLGSVGTEPAKRGPAAPEW